MAFEAPYMVTLPARTQPQNLINPIVAGTSTPLNVVASQQFPDVMGAAQKGMNIGQQLAGLPRQGAENAYQTAQAQIAKEHAAALQAQIKAIRADTTMTPQAQSEAITRAMIMSGYYQTQQGGGFNPQVPVGVMGPNYFRQGPETPQQPAPQKTGAQKKPAATKDQPPAGSTIDERIKQNTSLLGIGDAGTSNLAMNQNATWPGNATWLNTTPNYSSQILGANYPAAPIA